MASGVLSFTARLAIVAACGAVLSGCALTAQNTKASFAGEFEQPIFPQPTQLNVSLRDVPPPKDRITVAVYDFPDLTGQFKEGDSFQTLSKAVTQGGSTILIKALQDAGERRWFSVLDRASLDNLLKERQIVTEMRRLYQGEETISASALPPMKHAGIIIEGGIVGYDTNVITGGVGARYLGIGGDTKWIQDVVTVTLRAVSTASSEVLATVTVHKAIASQSLQGGVFRYVALDKLLEAEAGVTQNEPKQVAVEQAVEKAVMALVAEGALLKVWSFADTSAGAEFVANYLQEKHGGEPTVAAMHPVPPQTRNAAHVVQTTPMAKPAATPPVVINNYSGTPAEPNGSGNQSKALGLPPPPEAGEVLG